jgi:hypothetical protein
VEKDGFMPLNRRDVLKTLLVGPFFGAMPKLLGAAMSGPTVKGTLNILLNGLFFMERLPDPTDPNNSSKSLLAIHAPKVTDHVFLAGTRSNLEASTGFDWSTGFGLTGGSTTFDNPQSPEIPRELPASVLQFTRKETGVGGFKTDSNLFLGTVTLPWPKQIPLLRPDSFPPFDQGDSQHPKNIAPKIKARCGSQIGNVICLQYDCNFSGPVLPPDAPIMNVHLYMLCCKDSDGTVNHINAALMDSAAIFQSPGFDLNLRNVAVQGSPYDPRPPIPGITLEDERAAIEDGACTGMQTAAVTPNKKSTGKNKKPMANKNNRNVSPANCPAFFMG